MKPKPKIKQFCRTCGLQLVESMVGAEKHFVFYFEKSYPYSPFDENTGKRQYVLSYKCPSKRFWNFHDYFTDGNKIVF